MDRTQQHSDNPNYAKYRDLELSEPGAWVQILRQLSSLDAPTLSIIVIAILAAAFQYRNALSELIQLVVFSQIFVLGVAGAFANWKRTSNGTRSQESTKSPAEFGHAGRNQGST